MEEESIAVTLAEVFGKEAVLLLDALKGVALTREALAASEVEFENETARQAWDLLPSTLYDAITILCEATMTDDPRQALQWAQWRVTLRNHADRWLQRCGPIHLIK